MSNVLKCLSNLIPKKHPYNHSLPLRLICLCLIITPISYNVAADSTPTGSVQQLGTLTKKDMTTYLTSVADVITDPKDRTAAPPTAPEQNAADNTTKVLDPNPQQVLGVLSKKDLLAKPNTSETQAPQPTSGSIKTNEPTKKIDKIAPPETAHAAPLAPTLKPEKPKAPKDSVAEQKSTVLPNSEVPKKPAKTSESSLVDNQELDLRTASSLRVDRVEPISLVESVSEAIKHDKNLQAFKARIKGAKWDMAGAYAQYIPSLEVNYAEGAERSAPGSYNDESGSRVNETTHHRRDRSFYIRQPIVDLAIVSDIMRTGQLVDVTMADMRDAQETTAFDTIKAYLKLVECRSKLALYDQYKTKLLALSEKMEARYEEGAATDSDMKRIQSRINTANAARLVTLGQYGINIAEFKRLTGLVPAKFKTPEPLVPQIPSSPESALITAYKTSPTYLAALKKIDVARGDRDKSFAGLLPKVSVELSDSYVYNAGGAVHGDPIDGTYPNQRDKRAMLVGRWTLTGGTAVTAGMASIEKMKELNFKAQDARGKIEQGIHTAYDALNNERKHLALLKTSLQTDQSIVTNLEDEFLSGGRSLFEILDSQDQLHNTHLQLTEATFNEALLSYQVRLLMGEVAQAVLGAGVK